MEVDKKIKNFAQLMQCEIHDNLFVKNNVLVGSIEEKYYDLKDIDKKRIDRGNTKYHYIINDDSDIVYGAIIQYKDDILDLKTINTLDVPLEFTSRDLYNKISLLIGKDEVKIKVTYQSQFIEFHLMKREVSDQRVMECCNLIFGTYRLFYKNDQQIFSNKVKESIYFTDLVSEEYSGVGLELKSHLSNAAVQNAISLMKNELNILFGEGFFDRFVGTILDDYDLKHDFSYLDEKVSLTYKKD